MQTTLPKTRNVARAIGSQAMPNAFFLLATLRLPKQAPSDYWYLRFWIYWLLRRFLLHLHIQSTEACGSFE
jgi:hypothetical protein